MVGVEGGNSQGVEETESCGSRGSINEYPNHYGTLHLERALDVGFSGSMRFVGCVWLHEGRSPIVIEVSVRLIFSIILIMQQALIQCSTCTLRAFSIACLCHVQCQESEE